MPTLILHSGRRIDIAGSSESGGVVTAKLAGGGSFSVPTAQVKRVEGAAGPAPRPMGVAASRGFMPPDPNIGRPDFPFDPGPMPLSFPDNDFELGYRSDVYDMERAARDAAGQPERESKLAELAASFNQQRPGEQFDLDGALDYWRGDWRDPNMGYDDDEWLPPR